MKVIAPPAGTPLVISSDAVWPALPFQTDATGSHTWNWDVAWKGFTASGVAQTPTNQWDAAATVTNYGGTVTVKAQAGADSATLSVVIKGTNPTADELMKFLSTKPNGSGFAKILVHESHCRNFGATGEPLKSFDNGYGMCQLTTPKPAYADVWNWKKNVEAGLILFAAKRASAQTYLKQAGRTFTDDQLLYETVCRWNGGRYHEWDAKAGKWVRPATLLCDSLTGNIGWDLTDAANTGKTEAELHKRDAPSYSKPPAAGAHWRYSGVCYADAILR
ncbi:hypothetical protein BH10ACI4_BH10ACI4_34210 [soil metagenome]